MSSTLLSWLDTPEYEPIRALVEMGGPVILVLIALSVIALATVIYVAISGAWLRPTVGRSVTRAARQLKRGHPAAAEQHLNTRRSVDRLFQDILSARRSGVPGDDLRDQIAERATRLLQPFEAPHRLLEVVAALAPLLGLLGTVLGMMSAFKTMATTAGAADPALLSGGIYEALITTAGGLIVAIPVAAVAAWMDFRLRRISDQINTVLVVAMTQPLAETAPAEPEPAPSPVAVHARRSDASADDSLPVGAVHAAG